MAIVDEVSRQMKEAIVSSGAGGRSEIGRGMGALMKAHKGEIDGRLAKQIAGELLGD